MNYYLVCPYCGYKLLKASDCASIEVNCPKCNEKLVIKIKDDELLIRRVLMSKTVET